MPRRGRSRGRGGIAGLPEEIQQEILVRLPVKSVLRCRAVCRGWRCLTTDPAFLVAHHRHQPTLVLVRSWGNARNSFYPYCLDAVHLETAERRPGYWPDKYIIFHSSCDGLLVTDDGVICNPATRQLVPFLKSGEQLVGLYQHQPSGEYRVLFWRSSSIPSEVYCANDYCVRTVGSNRHRIIPCLITPVDMELISGKGPTIRDAPVTLHGNLYVHWQNRFDGRYHRILVFDTVAESLRQMRPPPVNPQHVMQLFDMDGTLAASSSKVNMTELRIFALLDYKSEFWSFQFRIKLPVMEIRRFQEQGDWLAKIVSGQCDVFVSCFGWLLHCDRKGNLLAKYRYDDDLPVVIPLGFKESLIQHTLFQKSRKN